MLCPNQGVNICSTPALCQRVRVIQLRDSHLLLRKKELNKRILMRETCPSFREFIRREGTASTPLPAPRPPPPPSHTSQKGRCLLDTTWSRALLISWLVVLVIQMPALYPSSVLRYPGRLPKELDPGWGRKNTWVWQRHCRPLGGLEAAQ